MTVLSPRREVGEFKKRYKWMVLAVLFVFGLLIARMVQLQIIQHDELAAEAKENITKTITLPATRGIIRDTTGRIIAQNRPSFAVYITPQLIEPQRDVQQIAELMGLSNDEKENFVRRLEAVPPHRRTHQIEMFSDITREQMAALETHANELRGVDVVVVPVRTYPYGHLSGHAVGYLNEINAEELEKRAEQGYRAGDMVGRSGVERAWESYLRGRRGHLRVLVDARGRLHESSEPGEAPNVDRQEPTPGRDLTLTLDMELMKSVERAFRGHPSGGVVLVEVNTGKVRALFSKPSYDLNEMSGRLTQERFHELTNNPFRPLIDKTVYETYFPGSTFKPISALAALGDGTLDPAARVDCGGFHELGNRRFRCTQVHGEVDMRRALARSCNVYFYRLAEQVGLDRLAFYAREFGFGSPTGIGINTENGGMIATKEWYVKRYGDPYRLGFTLNAAIGQGNTRVTLLQLAMAYAAMATGGRLRVPQLVERVSDPQGNLIEEFEPRVRRQVPVTEEQLVPVLQGLYGAVHDPDGTAHEAMIPGGVHVAGKTGTAEVSRRPDKDEDPKRAWYYRRDHAWFAGLAPAENPEVAVVVLVEHGGAGGKTAAPIGMQILEEYLGDRESAPGEVLVSAGGGR